MASIDNSEWSKSMLLIAGPCALETREQIKTCARALKEVGVRTMRASLWKPRTKPGWEGLGESGLEILLDETLPIGLTPATEVLTPEHARLVVRALRSRGDLARILVWLGSRNQNHFDQREIAQILADGHQGITLMAKNQMWAEEKHWLGIHAHLLESGFPKERLLLCHRGFAPGNEPNPRRLRNLPDFQMAESVRAKTGCRMIVDPSHIGGSRETVLEIIEESLQRSVDGLMVEVHCNPDMALTDAKQQLSLDQFAELVLRVEKVRVCA